MSAWAEFPIIRDLDPADLSAAITRGYELSNALTTLTMIDTQQTDVNERVQSYRMAVVAVVLGALFHEYYLDETRRAGAISAFSGELREFLLQSLLMTGDGGRASS